MPKILVIEDDPDLLSVLSQHLVNHKYDVLQAVDGQEGFQKVEEGKPDLIILDVKMPKLDGYTFIKELRTKKEHAQIPVMVLTAHSDLDSLFKVEGVAAYFTKPYEIEKILAVIKKVLGAG